MSVRAISLETGKKEIPQRKQLSLGHSLKLEVRHMVATDLDILIEFCVPLGQTNRAVVEGSGQVVVCL